MKTATVTEVLHNQLRDEVLVGKLVLCEKINEIKLANDLNVSRSSLREVLRILENERLVENIPRKGTFATAVSLEDFLEICAIREMIECRAIDIFKKNGVRELPLVEKAIKGEAHQLMPPRIVHLKKCIGDRNFGPGKANLFDFDLSVKFVDVTSLQDILGWIDGLP